MPNQLLVSGVFTDTEDEILELYEYAKTLGFDSDLIAPVSEVGHNSLCSFVVYPSGSGEGRESNVNHRAAMLLLAEKARESGVAFVVTESSDGRGTAHILTSDCQETARAPRRVVLHPGSVVSRNDKQVHHINALQLCRLYRLDISAKNVMVHSPNRHYLATDLHLFPRSDGNYTDYSELTK